MRSCKITQLKLIPADTSNKYQQSTFKSHCVYLLYLTTPIFELQPCCNEIYASWISIKYQRKTVKRDTEKIYQNLSWKILELLIPKKVYEPYNSQHSQATYFFITLWSTERPTLTANSCIKLPKTEFAIKSSECEALTRIQLKLHMSTRSKWSSRLLHDGKWW